MKNSFLPPNPHGSFFGPISTAVQAVSSQDKTEGHRQEFPRVARLPACRANEGQRAPTQEADPVYRSSLLANGLGITR